MKKRVQKKKIGVKASHRKSLKRNLLTSLIESGKVTTTTVKAKVLRSEAESFLATLKKREGVTLIRGLKQVLTTVKASKIANKLREVDDLKITVVKEGFRKGDNAEVSTVSISNYDKIKGKKNEKQKDKLDK